MAPLFMHAEKGIKGPVLVGGDTRLMSGETSRICAEVLAANDIPVILALKPLPTPVFSHEIMAGRACACLNGTASHNPPADMGLKYNPSTGGPAGSEITGYIETLANKYMENSGGIRSMTEEKIENPSAAQLTPDELRAKAAAYYGALFALRAKLEAEPLSEESYFVEFKKNQLAETPTLWDFALSRWISFFAERADSSVDADSYLLAAPSCEAGKDAAPALTALRLASCGELGGGTLRAQARELWRVKRLLMPFNQGGLNVSSTTAHAARWKSAGGSGL